MGTWCPWTPTHPPARLPIPLPVSPDAYVAAFHRSLGLEVASRREALGLSAYALAKAARVSDQTIPNLEQGRCDNGCWTGTLARVAHRIAHRIGVCVADLVAAAEALIAPR